MSILAQSSSLALVPHYLSLISQKRRMLARATGARRRTHIAIRRALMAALDSASDSDGGNERRPGCVDQGDKFKRQDSPAGIIACHLLLQV